MPPAPYGSWYVRTHYKNMSATNAGAAWFRANDPTALPAIPHLLTEPMIFQKLALFRMQISNCALWFDMGLGKTLIAIANSLRIFHTNGKYIFVVICPVSIFGTWSREIIKHISNEICVNVSFVHGVKKKDALARIHSIKERTPTFVLTSYETLEKVREGLEELDIGCIYFDEVSKIKNMDAARTKSAHTFVRNLPRVPRYCFSGTPSTAAVSGYYSLYELLWRGASGTHNIFSFKHQFEESKKFYVVEHGSKVSHVFADNAMNWLSRNYPEGSAHSYLDMGYALSEYPANDRQLRIKHSYQKVCGVKNLDKLRAITDTCSYCLKKTDVLGDLPPKTLQRREIEMTEEQHTAYASMVAEAVVQINEQRFSFKNLNTPFVKLHAIANGFVRANDDSIHYFKKQNKIDELIQTIEESGDQKIVVWAALRPQLAKIAEYLDKEEIGYVQLHGGIANKDRVKLEAEFTDNPECKIFLANPSVGGLGLNLQTAYLEVFMSNWYSPDVRAQAEDRCWRKGQLNAVSIWDFLSTGTLEFKILNALLKSISLENSILKVSDLTGETT